MAPTKRYKTIVKKTKKSKSEREDGKSFYCRLSKDKTRIGQRYSGDRMVTRSKASRLAQFEIKGCFVDLPRSYSSLALHWLRTTETHFDLKELNEQEVHQEAGPSDQEAGPSNQEAGPSHQLDEVQPIDGQSQQPLLTQLLSSMNEIQVPTLNVENDSNEMALAESFEKINNPIQTDGTVANVSGSKRPLPQLLPISEPPKKIANRRGSVAGGMMFSVDSKVIERASDNLERVSRPIGSIIIQGGILNEFDPFRRTKNISFSLKGRPRASSVSQRRPSLSTLWESDVESDYMFQKVERRRVSVAELPAGSIGDQENIAPLVGDVEQSCSPGPNRNWNETVQKWVGRVEKFN